MKSIVSIILAGILFSSCHGDLDVIQTSEVSANSMWQTEEDATSAMYGMYNKFRSTYSYGYIYWGEYRTGLWGDGLTGQTARTQVYQNQIPTDHGYANWADLYTTINMITNAKNSSNDVNVIFSDEKIEVSKINDKYNSNNSNR